MERSPAPTRRATGEHCAHDYRQQKLVGAMMAHPSCSTARREVLMTLRGPHDAERISSR